jgi:polar amino acid transport system substrate-binding protein
MRLDRLLLVLLLASAATAGRAEDVIVLNTGVGRPYAMTDGSGFIDKLVAEAFRRIGRKARVQTYEASERAMINADNGIDDGTALRIKGLEAQYPNLLRVGEKVIDNDFVAYSLRYNFPTSDWNSLAPYHVAYILGWKVFERNLPASVSVTKVKDPPQLFSLLRQDRTDVILYERWQGLWRAQEQGLAVHALEPPLARQEMFIYLHRKHADLVPGVERTLAEMKRDGSYQRIFDATLKPLTSRR